MVRYLACSRRQLELQRGREAYERQEYYASPSVDANRSDQGSQLSHPQSSGSRPYRSQWSRNDVQMSREVLDRTANTPGSPRDQLPRKVNSKKRPRRAKQSTRPKFDDNRLRHNRTSGARAPHSQSQVLNQQSSLQRSAFNAAYAQSIDQDRFYVIERLLDKRFVNGQEQYLVRWKNYPPDWDSWEPRSEIERNALDMINAFEKTDNIDSDDSLNCLCRRPYRPEQGGMIQCFNCHDWFHFICLGMNMAEANAYAKWHCSKCLDANSDLKNLIKPEKQHLHGDF